MGDMQPTLQLPGAGVSLALAVSSLSTSVVTLYVAADNLTYITRSSPAKILDAKVTIPLCMVA